MSGKLGGTRICGFEISVRGAVLLLAVLAMTLALAACGGGEEESTPRPEGYGDPRRQHAGARGYGRGGTRSDAAQ